MSSFDDAAFALVTDTAIAKGSFIVTGHGAWSFGTEIARRIDRSTVYVTDESYSVTTTTHINAIIRALIADGYEMTGKQHGGWEIYTR
jgi:hypothetical protein